jgi:hypothetical protein
MPVVAPQAPLRRAPRNENSRVPFVRFSRDRRGYEHTFLVHESGARGRSRSRVLYWFRTPPGIKVGREAFDDEVRRKIESENPGIAFDWPAIASTPMPPIPEVEHWRERRRAERAAKAARREEEVEAESAAAPAGDVPALEVVLPSTLAEAAATATAVADVAGSSATSPQLSDPPTEQNGSAPAESDSQARKRRRRRGGRRRRAGDLLCTSSPEVSGSSPQETVEDTGDHPAEAKTTRDVQDALVPPEPESTSLPSEIRYDTSQE